MWRRVARSEPREGRGPAGRAFAASPRPSQGSERATRTFGRATLACHPPPACDRARPRIHSTKPENASSEPATVVTSVNVPFRPARVLAMS